MNSFYDKLADRSKKRFALLVDPDKHDDRSLATLMKQINLYPPDLLLVGGSILFKPIDLTITSLKLGTKLPVFLFPGNVMQLSDSGRRNPLSLTDFGSQSRISHRKSCTGCTSPEPVRN